MEEAHIDTIHKLTGVRKQVPCFTYDFTLKFQDERWEDVGEWLNGWCKKWVFQKEEDASGYVHWQGRVSLIKKKRLNEVISQMKNSEMPFRWSVTTKGVHDGSNFNYVMKSDTRVDGPWKDSDYEEPPKMTWQLQVFMDQHKDSMLGWQKWMMQYLEGDRDMRNIICLIDETGHHGKSLFAEYLEYMKLAFELPPFTNSEDIMQCVMCINEQKAYLIDMPRAMNKDKLHGLYAGIESLKDGKCYDKRYQFKKRRQNRPKVIVFTNKQPDVNYLSADRWLFINIGPGGEMGQIDGHMIADGL